MKANAYAQKCYLESKINFGINFRIDIFQV